MDKEQVMKEISINNSERLLLLMHINSELNKNSIVGLTVKRLETLYSLQSKLSTATKHKEVSNG